MYILTDNSLGQISVASCATGIFNASERKIIKSESRKGLHNEDELTDKVFFKRHPKRKKKGLDPKEHDFKCLSQEWIDIRNNLVRSELKTLPRPKHVRDQRTCCMLSPIKLADPSSLGIHGKNSESVGILYTGKAGFVDLGHLRDNCDLTEFIYTQIVANGGSPFTIKTPHGEAKIIKKIPRSKWIKVARAISYDDSLGHEIMTYDIKLTGGHNSSFSPEDLCSNNLGTLVAERAIAIGGIFNTAATQVLDDLMISLNAQTTTETFKAFKSINGRWVKGAIVSNRYLKRRNFSRIPWKASHSSNSRTPTWIIARFGIAHKFYTYTHTLIRKIPKSQFSKEIRKIRKDAKKIYGSNYSKP